MMIQYPVSNRPIFGFNTLAPLWDNLPKSSVHRPNPVATAYDSLMKGKSNDYDIAHLDDYTRILGVTCIAGLASLSTSRPGGSLPFWIGGLAWLTAMAITPKIIHGLVRLKTGVNLDKKYVDSENRLKRLFKDPNYLPIDALPPDEQTELFRRFNIPAHHPDRKRILRKKLKQIATQTHTWWMLTAGFATPVIGSILSDQCESFALRLLGVIRQRVARKHMLGGALKKKNPELATQNLNILLNRTLGHNNITPMSQWWQRFNRDLLKTLKIDQFSQEVLTQPLGDRKFQSVINHLEKQLRDPAFRSELKTYLEQQHRSLGKTINPLHRLLKRKDVKQLIPSEYLALFQQKVTLSEGAASSTLKHLEKLLDIPMSRLTPDKAKKLIRHAMSKTELSYVEQLLREGRITQATRYAGSPENLTRVRSLLKQFHYGHAHTHMGSSPRSLLLNNMTSLGKRRQWLRRFPLLLGGLLIAGTAFFLFGILGRDFKHGGQSA